MDDIMVRRRIPAGAKAEQRIRDILRREPCEVFAEMGYERTTATTEIAQRPGHFRGHRVHLLPRQARAMRAGDRGLVRTRIIAAVEEGMPRDQTTKAQLEFFVRTHLRGCS
ncbi:hypothetical protein ACU4GH_31745 [Bradyrhizobium betae]